MTGEFEDDVFGGDGMPTQEQTLKVRDYLKRHNRVYSTRKVQAELIARGFDIGIATVGRHLKKIPGGIAPDVKKDPAEKRQKRARAERKREPPAVQAKAPPIAPADLADDLFGNISKMATLIANENTSTQLAIWENRRRMAINIIVCEIMAAKPALLLLDMRGTAALLDALTVGSKLSGGASIDISIPSGARRDPAPAQNGHANGGDTKMIDVTPKRSSFAASLQEYRDKQAIEKRGKGN